jgi:hypothetical protein
VVGYFERIRARAVRRVIAAARTFTADKPALRAMLRALYRRMRTRGWSGSGDPLQMARRVLDAAVPLRQQAADWGLAADRSPPLSAADMATQLAECAGSAGVALAISHDDYTLVFGGIQNVLADEQRIFAAAGWRYLHVSPAAPLPVLGLFGPADSYRVRVRLDQRLLGVVTFPVLAAALTALRAEGSRLEVIVHHMKGHVPEHLATLPDVTGSRPFVWAHDFFALCPSFNLMRSDLTFCGAPPAESAACQICVFGADRRDHLPRVKAFFEATHPVVLAPSATALELWLRCGSLPYAATRVVTLADLIMDTVGDRIAARNGGPLRIAHLGSSIRQKGWQVFEALASRHARDRRYQFYHLGVDGVRSRKYTHIPVRVTPSHRDAMVEAVALHQIDVVISWSLWPETFCFTMHEALAGGAFVIARQAAGNIGPAMEAAAPLQSRAVRDEAELSALFESGAIHALVTRGERRRGSLRPRGDTAELLLGNARCGSPHAGAP